MNDQLEKLLIQYNAELIKMNIKGRRCEGFCGETGLRGLHDEQTQICHLKWMLDEVLDNGKDWDGTALNRWVGFIQGILWCVKFRSTLEISKENKNVK